MVRRPVPLTRLGLVTLAVTAPALAALVALAALDRLGLGAAALAYAGVAGLTGLLLRPALQEVASVSAWARALAAGADTEPPQFRNGLLDDIVAAMVQQRRAWRGRQGDLSQLARWNESLFDNLPDPLVLLDRQRRVMRLNDAARALFGRDSAGRDLAVVLRDPVLLEAADGVLAGEAMRECDLALSKQSFRVRIDRLEDSPVDSSVAVVALHDLTAMKRLEQMRADFVANASHELRTPLATLLGFIETLQGAARDDAEARGRFLEIMRQQAERMTRLVTDLLSLSRVELNEYVRPTGIVDLSRLVEAGAAALQPLAAAKAMRLVLAVQPGLAILGQADELAQVVQNLVDNAVKYGRDGTEVRIALAPAATLPATLAADAGADLADNGAVLLSVADHGDGIAREHLPRLTERFYRVDTARSRALGGTGLGLAIVKHIVNRHRGALEIDSTPGHGTTVSVYLPLMPVVGQA